MNIIVYWLLLRSHSDMIYRMSMILASL
jgi:hypothetical protein